MEEELEAQEHGVRFITCLMQVTDLPPSRRSQSRRGRRWRRSRGGGARERPRTLEAPPDIDIRKAGCVVVLNTKDLPLVIEVGPGANLVRIEGHATCSSGLSSDSAFQMMYAVRRIGPVQVTGVDGKQVLETHVKGGYLLIVPRFFVVSKIADADTLSPDTY